MGLPETVTVPLEWVNCCNCGVPIGMPSYLYTQFRQNSARWFYCVNGHQQHFGESEVARLEKELEVARKRGEWLAQDVKNQRARAERTERSLSATKGVVTRMKRRTGNGVCPCCNRTFKQLQRHMQAKHPDFHEDAP